MTPSAAGRLVILSGPSCVGKSPLDRALARSHPDLHRTLQKVVLFNSRIAASSWGGSDVYSPPNRNWAFDNNFLDPTKLPPSTPQVMSITRGRWSLVSPNATSL